MSEVTEQILAIRRETLAQSAQQQQSVVDPVEAPKAEPEATEEQEQQVADPAPKDQPVAEAPKEETPVETSWDADETEPVKLAETQAFDVTKLGGALGFENVKSEAELTQKVLEIKSKLKQLEEAPLSGIPDDFKEVIKVAQSGGDWKDFLSSNLIDYTKVDAVQLFEDSFFDSAVKNPKYYTDGKFDPAKAREALDAIQEPVKEFQGMQIAEALNGKQKQKQAELAAKAESRLVEAEKSLSKATQSLSDILPLETYGIKFEPKHSSEIYSGIANSKLTKKYLGVSYETLVAQGADMKDVAATVAARHYLEKIVKHKSQQSKVEAKKEILEKTQNAQIRNTGSAVQPDDPDKKVLTPAEKIENYYKGLQKNWL